MDNVQFTTLDFAQPFSIKVLDLIAADLPNGYFEIHFKHLTCCVKVWRGRWKDVSEWANE